MVCILTTGDICPSSPHYRNFSSDPWQKDQLTIYKWKLIFSELQHSMRTIIHIQHPLAEEQHVRVKYSIYSLKANRQSLWYFWYICPDFGYISRCLLASIRVDGRLRMRIWSPTYARMVAIKHMQRRLKPGKTHYKIALKWCLNNLCPIGFSLANIWFHTDLTNLTEAASHKARSLSASPSVFSRMANASVTMRSLWDLWDLCEATNWLSERK